MSHLLILPRFLRAMSNPVRAITMSYTGREDLGKKYDFGEGVRSKVRLTLEA